MNVNKARFQQFLRQARGNNLKEIHVNRQDKRDVVLLRYNGKAPKKRDRANGEWSVPRGERAEADVIKDIKEFLTLARQHFFVHRGEGLEDEAFGDEGMEAKAKPIVKESE